MTTGADSLMNQSRFHNVLTPAAIEGAIPGQNQPDVDLIPRAHGDAQQFRAAMELRPVWGNWFKAYERVVDSPDAANFTVCDHGKLATPGKLIFHLHALRPFDIRSGQIRVPAAKGTLLITAPWAADARQSEDLINNRFEPVWHLELESGNVSEFNLMTAFNYEG